ncbi:glycosyltransferase family 2 protein [Pedobacter agri]|uniref:Glycosyltransferase family A protein n=1 Tax=Pedobacter agri TaxID=454586 RepID=A0A9X3I7D8_9SPHI|nr:glycosyltransferase family A protein [Pedobacter agri]MCX3263636.1 glycosyltransferase family A protein [Pedobacter agri]
MVSVIIPNYNHAHYLKQRIDSVLNQTYKNFEIIILDDCSTDNSKEIIEQYRNNPKVSNITFNDTNSGSTFKQWNKGIALSKGKYVWIAESDDYADSKFLELTVQQLNDNNDVNLCFTQSYRIDKNNVIIDNCLHWYGSEFQNAFLADGKNFIKKSLWAQNQIYNASAVLFRKSAYPYPAKQIEKLKFVGDWYIYIMLIENGKIAYLPNILNYFRQHQTSVTSKLDNSTTHLFESYLILKHIASNRLYINYEKYNIRLNYLAGLLLTRKMSNRDFLRLSAFAIKFDYLLPFRLAVVKSKLLLSKNG